jgi:hypothetical protein
MGTFGSVPGVASPGAFIPGAVLDDLLAPASTRLGRGGGSPTDLTGLLEPLGSNTGITWKNTGREILLVSVGSTPTSLSSRIPIRIQGESVDPQPSGELAANAIWIVGPYDSQFDEQPSGTVTIDFSSTAGVSVALIRGPAAA